MHLLILCDTACKPALATLQQNAAARDGAAAINTYPAKAQACNRPASLRADGSRHTEHRCGHHVASVCFDFDRDAELRGPRETRRGFFGHRVREPVLSDVDVLLCVENADTPSDDPGSDSDNPGAAHTVLQQFPAHRTILSASPVFEAQVLRWQTEEPAAADDNSSSSSQRQIRLVLPDDSYEPAALAVLAFLYSVKPEPLAELTADQLVQAAVLADMWEVPAAGSTAVELLTAAANSAGGLPAAAVTVGNQLLGMPAVPACLLPVLQQALLSRFGDLEAVVADADLREALLKLPLSAVELLVSSGKLKADQSLRMSALPRSLLSVLQQALLSGFGDLQAVWADAEVQKALLALPLVAVELLLSSDELKVASEDTVLYTAQTYVKRLPTLDWKAQQQVAQDRLVPLVRCPHLSQFWLSAVLSDDAPKLLLSGLQTQLKRLILAQEVTRTQLTADEFKEGVPNAPASWLLPARVTKPVSSVTVEWAVVVADIRRAALQAASRGETVRLSSPSSAPLQGVAWCMKLHCVAAEGQSTVGLFACADNLPAGTVLAVCYSLECVGFVEPRTATTRFKRGTGWGVDDFFGVGALSGGFDAVAWAAKGLPAEGQLVFRLTVERAD